MMHHDEVIGTKMKVNKVCLKGGWKRVLVIVISFSSIAIWGISYAPAQNYLFAPTLNYRQQALECRVFEGEFHCERIACMQCGKAQYSHKVNCTLAKRSTQELSSAPGSKLECEKRFAGFHVTHQPPATPEIVNLG